MRSISIISLCILLLTPTSALSYSIHSGLTDGCHERITRNALLMVALEVAPSAPLPLPQSETWEKVAEGLLVGIQEREELSQVSRDNFKIVLVSLILGVRSPDTEGHAVTNFSSLRQIHADPSPEGQYAHALRGPEDDGTQGDEVAVNGTREAILELIEGAQESIRDKSPEDQVITVQLYFDFYGLVDIEVWEPAYLIGRSLHALQDSFAHTIRSDDLKRVLHVLNYVDAIAGDLKESVDGLPHSTFMDQCDGDTAVIAEAATLATSQLMASVNLALTMGDAEVITTTLDEWLTYEPGCSTANDYCSSIWVEFARREPTGPYLEEFLGCQAQPHRSSGLVWAPLLCLMLLIRLRRYARNIVGLGVLLITASLPIDEARADTLIQTELHASVLSDAPDRSVLANTYGWGLRAGHQWEAWALFAHIEQNLWLSTELSDRTARGVLNAGVGGAYQYGGGAVRTSLVIGTSTLLFDTLFDESGTTGVFLDMRPVDIRWAPLAWLTLNLTPLSFTYVSPVLGEPGIRMVLYRTVFGVEFKL